MANNKQKQVYKEFGVVSDEEFEEIIKEDWRTIPCMGGCGTPIFVEKDEYVWVFGDPYHKECVGNDNSS